MSHRGIRRNPYFHDSAFGHIDFLQQAAEGFFKIRGEGCLHRKGGIDSFPSRPGERFDAGKHVGAPFPLGIHERIRSDRLAGASIKQFCNNSRRSDIDRDGMMQGYDLDLARSVRAAVDIPVTMLGGAGKVDHLQELIDMIGTCGAAAGSLFVFNGVYRAVLVSYARP